MKLEKINNETGEAKLSGIEEKEWLFFIRGGYKLSKYTDFEESSCFNKYFIKILEEYIEREEAKKLL